MVVSLPDAVKHRIKFG